MLDNHGRRIEYLRVSLTDRCNLRCIYCMPENGIEKRTHEDNLRFEEAFKIIKASSTLGIKKVRFTGGEPLILNGIDELIYKTSHLPSIEDISITTNGILLDEMVSDLKKAGLKRVNISLDSLKEDKFREITRGGSLKKVLSSIEKCISMQLTPVKINIVLMRGINDSEIADFINLTRDMPVSIRFIELMPIGEGIKLSKNMMKLDEVMDMYPNLIPITDKSSTAEVFKLDGSKGTVGFIRPLSCKFCSNCNRIRLTSSGTIKPCLHSEDELDVKKYVDNEIKLVSAIKDAIYNKPGEHHLENGENSSSKRMMYQIGG